MDRVKPSFKEAGMRALLLLFAVLLLTMSLPVSALAMEVQKCTARPNGDTGSDVLGGLETRINWEGQAAEDESVAAMSITMPEGTAFSPDRTKVTMLSGAKNMDRTDIKADFADDNGTLIINLADPLPNGAYVRVEIYGVVFPSSGGDLELTGTYTLVGGTVMPFDYGTIQVKGISATEQLSSYLDEQDWVKAWNSNNFLRLFFNPTIIVTSIPLVFNGFLMAIAIVAISFPLAIPVGLLLALMRMAKVAVLRGIATTYVNVVRGTPLFLQIYIAFFGLPLAGISVPPFVLGVIVLSMNSAAYMCEIMRAGIQSIPKGQTEASRSLGMSGAQTMVFVIIPQTVRRIIPTMTSEFILLYKDTSMLAAVGVMEMVFDAKTIVATTGSITPYIVAACFYLIITLPLAKIVGNLERRLDGVSTKKRKKKDGDSGDAGEDGGSAVDAKEVSGEEASGVMGLSTDALVGQPSIKSATAGEA